mmetsp:Transcript_4716/g.9665  ORF Transcript_4716/g.9665 Transcript_4716/m.9665 type:complete len:100 (-) Transcript_4716:16-315(-)
MVMGWLLSSELLLASSTLQGLFVAGWRLYGLRTLWTELILATMDKTLHTNFSESSERTRAREHEWNFLHRRISATGCNRQDPDYCSLIEVYQIMASGVP